MKAGFFKVCINPPVGTAMEGLKLDAPCTSIHDDLFVRTLYLTHRKTEALIVTFDLLFFDRAVIDRFKTAIGKSLNLGPGQVFFNTSHTHAGPQVSRWNYSDGPDPRYLDQIENAIVQAAGRAKSQAVTVTLWAGQTRTDLPVSRRLIGPDGKAQWKPSRTGPICDALPFCLLKDTSDKVVAVLFSVACHPSMIYESSISADYPGAAMKKLNAHFQTDGSLFLQGAGGETKPRHVADGETRWRHGTWEEMEAAGAEVADAVIAQARQSLTKIAPDLRFMLQELQWPLAPVPPRAHFAAALQNPDTSPSLQRWATEMLQQLDQTGHLPQTVPVALHGLQLGKGLRLIGVAGEIVAPLGLLILREFNHGVTFPLGYSNGCQIYLTTDAMLPEGGYEVDSYWEYHWPAPLAPGGEQLLLNAVRQIRDSGQIPND